ncbi:MULTISPECIES: protease modulator HflC [Kosmotoga]|uniref:Protein HflC n=1 Tax=Kosmotoga olearia (strain ATCC BAA-1733 / DSM 21960 / TBF 19.5.1) TaxID=521045 RepID=C5CD44_KOSOT|nr:MULTISPECIES: protease modulator HflC [Kosmotoga]ACR78988.1 HflC protein [Kosmotoga olearia TBF 19.5.1]MDK2953426.1 modulator of FtsH protease HflC [Kosmotoga sp.]OAA24039.1 membrane protein [Kosmotoga sp. DU53]
MKAIITIVILAIIALILVPEFFYIVDQTKQAVVLRFGEIKEVSTEPGLHTKQPFVDKVVRFDKRLQIYDVPAERIFTKDKKTLLVDTIAVWKIVDPEKFVKTMKSVDLALTRIDDVVYSIVRNTFGKLQFDEVISGRGAVLEKVTLAAAEEMKDYGILIVSVRVKRAVLPDENKNAVFNRMKSERYQEAALIRAEGEKEANMIRAEADKLKVIALAEAQKKAEIIKGTAEASALRIYAEAFSDDPEFYEFWKRLVVYEETLPDSKFILSPDMSFIEKLMKGE